MTRNEDDLDKIFNGKRLEAIKNENFSPILPPELKANRSIIIFNVEEDIYNNNEDDIKNEISIYAK